MPSEGTEKEGGETKSKLFLLSGATSSWNKRTSMAPGEEQITFHVPLCPETFGRCLKVRWTEWRPTASNFLQSPGTQPRKNEVFPWFDLVIHHGLPCFSGPYWALSRELAEVEASSAIWKSIIITCVRAHGHISALWANALEFPGGWTPAEHPFVCQGPGWMFPYPFLSLELSFFLNT